MTNEDILQLAYADDLEAEAADMISEANRIRRQVYGVEEYDKPKQKPTYLKVIK